MRLSENQYQDLIKGRPIKDPRPAKYQNVKVEVDGHLFDSKREAARYYELRLREQVGEIVHLELQPKFSLDINGIHIANYIADFQYDELPLDDMQSIHCVEDVKSPATRKLPAYRLKVKMMKAIHEIEVKET